MSMSSHPRPRRGQAPPEEVYRGRSTRAAHDSPVVAETGTGKEVIATAIHTLRPPGQRSPTFVRRQLRRPHENFSRSEIFGHIQGLFTGAGADKVGRIRKRPTEAPSFSTDQQALAAHCICSSSSCSGATNSNASADSKRSARRDAS